MDRTKLPLLRTVLEHVTAHPEEHDQDFWALQRACGTTRCIAGWATYLSGCTERWETDPLIAGARGAGFVTTPNGPTMTVPRAAASLLGLDDGEASVLFYAENGGVWEAVEEITDGALIRADVAGARWTR